jgi:tRNA-dihydrouridine synthase A
LRYADVYRLKADFPELTIEINGGITTLEQSCQHLQVVDGVMIGRAAYDNPYLFALADRCFYGAETPAPTRRQVLEALLPYLASWDSQGLPASRTLRHLLGLFAHQRVAKAWRRFLSTHMPQSSQAAVVLRQAMQQVPDEILDARPVVSCAVSS